MAAFFYATLPQTLPQMMSYTLYRWESSIRAAAILGVCLLGLLVSLPNLFRAPAAWLPWRTVHLGLDLKGGSYLLMEVDMKAVVKERLDSLVDAVRQAHASIPVDAWTDDPHGDPDWRRGVSLVLAEQICAELS